jgi:osmotically inducible protein OsmC
MPNTAHATWTGALKEGTGRVKLGQGAFEADYTFKTRFEGEGGGTNPEELIGAALAACFSMATSAELGNRDIEPENVDTRADVTLEMVDGTPTVTRIALTTTVAASGADEATVREAADAAKTGCPISRALSGVEDISLDLTVNA